MTAGFTPAPLKVSKTAAGDLLLKQYYAVKLNTSGQVVACTASTDLPYGILQNTPVTDEVASIAPINGGGSSYIYLSGTLATAALVAISTTGAAAADAATGYNIGQLEAGGAVGEAGVIRLGNITVKA